MPKPFKLRYVNELAGAFVLAAIALMVVVIITIGYTQRWFAPMERVILLLPEEGSYGLRRGADVSVLGTVVGWIDDITVGQDGRMRARASLQADFMRFVRDDSRGIIRKTLGFGDASIEITRGEGKPLENGDALIPVIADRAPTQLMEETIDQLRTEAIPAFRQLRLGIEEYTKLAAELRNPHGELQTALANANRIAANVETGDGVIQKLLYDDKFAAVVAASVSKVNVSLDEAQGILTDMRGTSRKLPELTASAQENMAQLQSLAAQSRETLQQVQAALKDIQMVTAQLPRTIKSVDESAQLLPGLLMQTQETMRQVQKLAESAQNSWLLGGGSNDEQVPPSRIRPERIGTAGRSR